MTSEGKRLSKLTVELQNQMDQLLEGVQIIDNDWKYIYLNDVLVSQINIPKSGLLGKTMMAAFPGIENTEMFGKLRLCSSTGQTQRFQNFFEFEDGTAKWFEVVAQKIPEGMCVLTLDVSLYKEALQNSERIKNLYSFLRQINQGIVHLKSEKKLLSQACLIGVEHGKYNMAWIGKYEKKSGIMPTLGSFSAREINIPRNLRNPDNEVQKIVLETGAAFIIDSSNRDLHPETSSILKRMSMNSMISLPLRKNDRIFATFNLYSEHNNFIGTEEIDLLLEVSGDLSFALDNFERATRHKRTEKLVLENEKRFRSLIEKSADMKTLANANGEILYGSPSITKVMGYVPQDIPNLSVFDVIHPDDIPQFLDKRRKVMEMPNACFDFEMRMAHKNGGYLWTEGTVTNLLEEPGVNAVVSNFRDITDKRNVKAELEFHQHNIEALINNTNALQWSVDRDKRLIISNRRFDEYVQKIYGFSIQPGQPILHGDLSSDNFSLYQNFYDRALSGEAFSEVVATSIADRWSEISFYPISNGSEIVGTACSARDITSQLILQKNLEFNVEQLLRANAELDRFVYSISHDLRSPLTSIRGLLSIIEEETQEVETAKHTKMIQGRIDRLDMFIKNVLNYSRINRTEMELQHINIKEIISEIIESLSGIKSVTDIKFSIDINQQGTFCSDRQAFSTIMENLISNAIKFQEPERLDKYIRISGSSNQDYLELIIEDNGIGIPMKYQNEIFKMFFRLPGPTEGSGIGLYIVNQAVEKLNGTIELAASENKGTKFKIQLKNLCDGTV